MSMNKIGNQNMERQTFHLPPQMNNIVSATIIDTTNGDVLFCHDQHFLYAAKITKQGGNVIFQRFNLPGLERIFPIIRNYFSVIFVNSMLVVFQVWFNEENKVMLKYAFNKMDRPCSSFFLRQVVQNMAELQLSYPENDVFVYQFTVNGKVGHMDYTIGPQNKIKFDRQQLYGSKTMLFADKKTLYYFTNFSSKSINSINLNKFQKQICEQNKSSILLYLCLPKIQEHYVILSNLFAINVTTPSIRHRIQIQQSYIEDFSKLILRKSKPSFKVSSYFDMFMLEDSQINITMVFQVKQKGSALVAVEYGNFNWFWTSTRKIIGLSKHRNSFKVIDNLSFTTRNDEITDEKLYQEEQKRQYMIHHERSLRNLKKKPQLIQNEQFIHQNNQNQDVKPTIEKAEPEKGNDNNEKSQIPINQKKEQQIPVQNFKISKEELDQRFVPRKVIQKKGVNISKSINKPKQIEPISKSSVEITTTKEQKSETIEKKVEKIVDQNQNINNQLKQQKQNIQQQKLKQKKEPKKEIVLPQQSIENIKIKQEQCQMKIVQQRIPDKIDNNNQLNQKNIQQENQKQEISIDIKLIEQIIQSDPKIKVQEEPLKAENNQSNLQDNLTKNVALMMQKQNIAGQPSICSINRNKIFNLATLPSPQLPFDNPFLKSLKKYPSQNTQYYNPLLSPAPLQTHQKQNSNDSQKLSIEAKLEPVSVEHQSNPVQICKKQESIANKQLQIINKIKELFQSTTTKLLNSIQNIAIAFNNEPYLKDRIIIEIERRVMETLRRQISGQFTVRVQSYFKQIFRQANSIQEQSLKFYKEATLHKSGHIQVQLNNQQKILHQIKEIQSMLRFSISNLRLEGKQTYSNLMRDWAVQMKQAKQIVTNLNVLKNKLEEDSIQRNKRYQQTKKNLQTIKNKLIQRANFQEERRLKKLEKTSLKLKQQEQKKKKNKKNNPKAAGEKQKKSKLKRSTNE